MRQPVVLFHICVKYNLTIACFNQMARTKSDKCKVGLEYISKLSSEHVCKSFSGGDTTCTCIVNHEDKISDVKLFFEKEVKEFWKVPCRAHEWACNWKAFWRVFVSICSFASQRAGYIFPLPAKTWPYVFPL